MENSNNENQTFQPEELGGSAGGNVTPAKASTNYSPLIVAFLVGALAVSLWLIFK